MKKICAECGKEFEAKSARQKYCNGPHFRPCPICGKPVNNQWLSYGPERCSDCKGKRISRVDPSSVDLVVPQVSEESVLENIQPDNLYSDLGEVKKYVGKSAFGLVSGNYYATRIEKQPRFGYFVHILENLSSDDTIDVMMPISSMNSYHKFFQSV